MNKNLVPNDARPAAITSGIRLGTAAITTRGFLADSAAYLGHLIADILFDPSIDVTSEIATLCARYPIPLYEH